MNSNVNYAELAQTKKEINEAIARLEAGIKQLRAEVNADIKELKQWRANLERDA